MMRSAWSFLMRILLGVALACSAAGCQSVQPYEKPLPLVDVHSISTYTPSEGLRYSAVIKPATQLELAFRVGGYVNHIHEVKGVDGRLRLVQAGDLVKGGTLLAGVRQGDYATRLRQCRAAIAENHAVQQQSRARLAQCLASLEGAQLNFDRGRAIWENNSLTKPEYDALKTKLDVSKSMVDEAQSQILVDEATAKRLEAQVEEARLTLADCSLMAPSDCIVVKRNIEVGSLVASGSVAFVLADTSLVKAVFGVPDVMLNDLFVGQRLNVTTESLPGFQLPGQISSVSPAADPKSRVFEIEVTVPNPEFRLKIGMIASLTVQPRTARKPSIVVPLAAIVRPADQSDGYAVFVVEEKDGKALARQRNVALGESFGNMIAVTEGVSIGDRVVTTGSARISDGAQIDITP